jgi:hypothetical protein
MADRKQDELDSMLDAALAKYAAVKPRTGLENRILANLRAERTRVPDRAWWRWSVAGALAAVVVVALALAWRSGKPSHPIVENHSLTAPHVARQPATPVVAIGGRKQLRGNQARPQESVALKRGAAHRLRSEVVADNPKLDQFPSSQPLSEQELALARYVLEFPHEATLIAQAQAEFEKEIQQQMNDARSQTENDSDREER